MLRGKKARYECGYGCCRDHKPRKYGQRSREKRAWQKEAR